MEDNTETKQDEKTALDSSEQKKKNPDHQPSQRQLDHLKYAREMKKLKQATREHEVETNNKHLDFIYKRLTNIEKNVNNLVEVSPNTGSKRARSKSFHKTEESSEEPEKIKKPKRSTESSAYTPTFIYDSFLPLVGRALFIGAGGIILSLLKSYATTPRRTTGDGDSIGGYYLSKDI